MGAVGSERGGGDGMGGFADAADLYGGIGCFGLSGGTGGRNFPEAVRCGVLLYGGDGILGVCGAPGSLCGFRIASRRDGGLCGGCSDLLRRSRSSGGRTFKALPGMKSAAGIRVTKNANPDWRIGILTEKRSFDWTSWIKREISLQKGNGYDKIFPQLTKKGLKGLDRSKT